MMGSGSRLIYRTINSTSVENSQQKNDVDLFHRYTYKLNIQISYLKIEYTDFKTWYIAWYTSYVKPTLHMSWDD